MAYFGTITGNTSSVHLSGCYNAPSKKDNAPSKKDNAPSKKDKEDMYTIETYHTVSEGKVGYRAVGYIDVDGDAVPVFETGVYKTEEKARKVMRRTLIDLNTIVSV